MRNTLHLGDCLEVMKQIPAGSIDMILCDLPYGVTRNKWDSVIDLDDLWSQYRRIIKRNGAIVLHGQGLFSARLMLSNEKMYRYSLVWEKTNPSGHLNAKRMPMRCHEDLLVFYKRLPTYNPQMTHGHERKVSTAYHRRNSKRTTNYGKHGLVTYDSTSRYPRSVLRFPADTQKFALHPTQKPVALLEWLIRTYTNEGELVLDSCAGSGSVGIACKNTGRDFVLIERERGYCDIIAERLLSHRATEEAS